MIIRIGIPASFRRFTATAREIGAPVLVSANAFWRNGRFGLPNGEIFGGADVALDSAGFVAMLLYWGYRWSLGDYVNLAGRLRPTWWAAPDYCCEPDMMPDLPALVGVGSVCRRALGGPAGVMRVVAALDRELPARVGLHLFGVKGSAIGALAGHPRIFSVDSAAWDFAARREKQRHGQNFNLDYRESHMRRWYSTQQSSLGLFA